jgi:protein-tyrosine-phosphatase
MAPGVTNDRVEPQNHPEKGHGVHPVLSGLWRGGRPPHGPGIRVAQSRGYDEGANQRAREDSQDQLDEACIVALMHSARYQQALRRYQARKIRRRDFNEGDLVLRLRQDNRGRHKLSPPWEGPYVVVKVLKPVTYKLANEDGEELTNAWNIQQLCRFYP